MQKEAQEYVKKCDQCQRFAPNIHQPGEKLNPLSSPWPFAQWGLDILGPFPKAIGNRGCVKTGQALFGLKSQILFGLMMVLLSKKKLYNLVECK